MDQKLPKKANEWRRSIRSIPVGKYMDLVEKLKGPLPEVENKENPSLRTSQGGDNGKRITKKRRNA